MFHEIPRTIPNYLSSYTLLVVSPVLTEASVSFSLNYVLNDGVIQEVLNSKEDLLGSDGWPPVLLFIEDRETHSNSRTHALMERRRSYTKRLVCMPLTIGNHSARLPKVQGKPKLVVFSDSSSVAYTAVIYEVFEVSQDQAGPWSSSLSCRQSHKARLLLSKARVTPLASTRDVPVPVTWCLDSECTISSVKSENGL